MDETAKPVECVRLLVESAQVVEPARVMVESARMLVGFTNS